MNKYLKKLIDMAGDAHNRTTVNLIDAQEVCAFRKIPKRQRIGLRFFFSKNAIEYMADVALRTPKKEKKEIKEKIKITGNLNDCLKILNNLFTLNKNVKKQAYNIETSDYCYVCDRHIDEGLDNLCPEHEWNDCRYEHTTVDYNLRDKEYDIKTMLLITAIRMIKDNRLPIKYGKNDNIVYFEYCGNQVSFHDKAIRCKPFAGEWTGIKNKKIPFGFLLKNEKKIINN